MIMELKQKMNIKTFKSLTCALAVTSSIFFAKGTQANVQASSPNISNQIATAISLGGHSNITGLGIDARLSGDIVGNGHITSNDFDTFFNGPLFLDRQERIDRNNAFDRFIRSLNINEVSMRSGDIVGNGGGLMEGQASFYYYSLANHIIKALDQTIIYLSEGERVVLQEILKMINNDGDQRKLLFISQDEYPGLFMVEGEDPSPRLAKTAFDSSYPIYINRDYAEEYMTSNPSTWLGVFIHELGHQLGIASHRYLDTLGAKVVASSESTKRSIKHVFNRETRLILNYHNFDFVSGYPVASANLDDQLVEVEGWRGRDFGKKCDGDLVYSGLTISNLHWVSRYQFSKDNFKAEAAGWGLVQCLDPVTQDFYFVDADFVIEVRMIDHKLQTHLRVQEN